ncbi:MAG: PIN domain-containing protein [bacterium]
MKNRKPYLLDTSAIMTFLEDEPGAHEVEKILYHGAVIPFVTLLEIYYITLREQGEPAAEHRYALLKRLPVRILSEVPEPVLLKAGYFKSRYKISLADSMIAAFAWAEKAVLVHKDPEYEQLETEGLDMVKLPYKS